MNDFDYNQIGDIALSVFFESVSEDEKERRKQIKNVAKTADSSQEVKDFADSTKSETVEDAVTDIELGKEDTPKKVSKKQSSKKETVGDLGDSSTAFAINQIAIFRNLFEKGNIDSIVYHGQEVINELINLTETADKLMYKVDAGRGAMSGTFPVLTGKDIVGLEKKYSQQLESEKTKGHYSTTEELKKGRATVIYTHNKKKIPEKITFRDIKPFTFNTSNVFMAIKLDLFGGYLIKMMPGNDFEFFLIMNPDKTEKVAGRTATPGYFFNAFDTLVQNF